VVVDAASANDAVTVAESMGVAASVVGEIRDGTGRVELT